MLLSSLINNFQIILLNLVIFVLRKVFDENNRINDKLLKKSVESFFMKTTINKYIFIYHSLI